MRKNFKPDSILFPMPVLIIGTYDKDLKPNAMTAAWGCIYDTNQVYVCLASDHKTSENIRKRRVFSLSFATKETVAIADYFGIKSGYKEDKITKAKVVAKDCEDIEAPYFEAFPVFLECKVSKIKDDGQTMYVIADILNISATEEVLNEKGKIDISKLHPICFDPATNGYNVVGKRVGDAFKEGLKIK